MQKVKLNDGYEIPVIGLGTSKSDPSKLFDAVCYAIDVGYRHFDCALSYYNEAIIGDAFTAKLKEGKLKREDLFITGKLWRCFHRPENMDICINESLKRLQIEYFDLYLMHFPTAHAFFGINNLLPENENGLAYFDEEVDYVETWKNMKKFVQSGKARSIGVSNFNKYQISRILNESVMVPAVNQIENHPYLNEDNLVKFCQASSIHVTGYCPVGAANRADVLTKQLGLLDDPILQNVATKYNKSAAQIALRFNIQRGLSLIPKSVIPSRVLENLNVFDFSLTSEDMHEIYSLECGKRFMKTRKFDYKHKYYPFQENYKE